MDAMEAIDNQEITVSLNAYETAVLMKAISVYCTVGLSPEDQAPLRSVLDKFGPGIHGQVAKQIQIKRDGQN
ncbi:MAG TPA: hypothetical protein VEL31_23365 [Ktedonobacteraceae bacterium]|nr:hypothetical protein [Ktedonobacteraceae bacterium]